MPAYPGAANSTTPTMPPPLSIGPGDWAYVFGTGAQFGSGKSPTLETFAAGIASDRVAIARTPNDSYPSSVSVELIFSGAPGAFEVDLQDSDTDADAYFQSIAGASLTAVSANNTARLEQIPLKGKFARLYIKTLTNAVNIAARLTR